MPQLGETIAEGTIGRWLKRVGDSIEVDEPLVEVITDKVNAEVPAAVAGTLTAILAQEGQTVEVGTKIALIEPAGTGAAVAAAPAREPVSDESNVAARLAEAESHPAAERPDDQPHEVEPAAAKASRAAVKAGGQRRPSPLVRQLARQHQVDLAKVTGSGESGRVTKADLLTFVQRRQRSDPGADQEQQTIVLTPAQRAMAHRMAISMSKVPHAWLMMEVDATCLLQQRARHRQAFQREHGCVLTYLPLVAHAVVRVLGEHRRLNARWVEDRIVSSRSVNLSIAVASGQGLMVPVIHNAHELDLVGLALAIEQRVARARAGKLKIDEVQGGTFTLNNTGTFGSIASQPIINHPQVAIVNMEAIVKRAVVVGDETIAIRPMMNLCLSFDHRLLDGQQAGRFLKAVKESLETKES